MYCEVYSNEKLIDKGSVVFHTEQSVYIKNKCYVASDEISLYIYGSENKLIYDSISGLNHEKKRMLEIKEYRGYKVEDGELNENLSFICFTDYDIAYEIMFYLNSDGYMIQDLEEVNKDKYIVWFNNN